MAIAFDVASDNGSLVGPSTSITWSHTCTGTNRILFAGFFGNTTDTVTGVTYNGVAMSFVAKKENSGDRWIYVYMLVNPASGTHDIVASSSSNSLWRGLSVSYTGAAQSGQPDASGTNSGTSITSLTTTITVVTANSWAVLLAKTGNGDPTASTGSTEREVGGGNGIGVYDSNGTLSAGSHGMAVTASSGSIAGIMVSFAPFVESTFRSKNLLTLGVS